MTMKCQQELNVRQRIEVIGDPALSQLGVSIVD
jgi:hypothetical protein